MNRNAVLLLLLSAGAGLAQPPVTVAEETFHGRRAWVLSNGLIRVSLLTGGGHIAEVRFLSDDPKKNVNPMRVPHYPTIEPHLYDPARHDAAYGDTPHKRLSSGYMGHLLCFPFYGPPSEDEARQGLGNHGEAPVVEWRRMKTGTNSEGVTFWYGADLPKTQFRVERAVSLSRGQRTVRVEEWVENLARFDRPVNWMQHATFGPPFVEPGQTALDTSAVRAVAGDRLPDRVFPPQPKSGAYHALRLDPARAEQFFTLYHPGYRVLIGYLFPSEGSPWLADWQENRRNTTLPWNGQVVARGIEFGSTPYAEGLRRSVQRNSLLGTPAFRWIGARQRLKMEFTIFLEEIPAGFGGVKDARIENGVPVLVPRDPNGRPGT
ncbi:MAG: hypothetical protein HY822_10945 [Acidobacteria bacterium]|nr:hypothetical protein [Acidobacteriota bacterium]